MSDSNYSASASTLGYLYQVRYALYMLLQSNSDEIELTVEQLDDVAFSKNGSPIELMQLKHTMNSQAKLTNLSKEFWKTIRIWSDYIHENGILENTILSLVTTASTSNSDTNVLRHLKPNAGRDINFVTSELVKLANKSTSKELAKAFEAFKSLTDEERKSLINSIHILDGSPSISDTADLIKQSLLVHRDHREPIFNRLEGWWFNRVIHHLQDGKSAKITRTELLEYVVDVSHQFKPDALPIDFLYTEPPEVPNPDTDKRRFVSQLKMIALNNKQIELAIKDYFRAFEQRSRWQRERLVNINELEKYEKRLIESIERERLWQDSDVYDDQELILHGRELFRWAEQADLRIRPQVTEPYVMRGSFHILANADSPLIYWHPKFVDRLREIVELPVPSSDWERRPTEVANLLNPAFVARLIRDTVKDYSSQASEGMPFALLFLILPIILHKPTRELLPKSVRKKLHSWLRENPNVTINFAQRTKDMKKITREGLLFAIDKGVIEINDSGFLISTSEPLRSNKSSELTNRAQTDVKEIERKAKFLGRWFSKSGSTATIFIMWGVRP